MAAIAPSPKLQESEEKLVDVLAGLTINGGQVPSVGPFMLKEAFGLETVIKPFCTEVSAQPYLSVAINCTWYKPSDYSRNYQTQPALHHNSLPWCKDD